MSMVLVRWPLLLRVAWSLTGISVIGSLAGALAGRSEAVRATAIGLAAIAWGLGLVAVLVPHPMGLTTLRLAAPVIAALGVITAVIDPTAASVGAACLAVLNVLIVMAAATGEWCVDGPAYPNEARFPLRPPVIHQLLTVPLFTAIMTAGLIAGPLLLASRQWAAGAVGTALATGWTVIAWRGVHQLSRRFVVFVPAGFVVHDALVLREPVLFRRNLVESIEMTPADSDTLDLTAGASGMSIDVLLEEKVEITRLSTDRRSAEIGSTAMFRVAPTRPGRVLAEAHARRYPALGAR
jgi:hypothetical protein